MRHAAIVSALVIASSTACFAQTGFTTKTYTVPRNSVLRSADFNKDGKPDLLITGGSTPSTVILLNDGSGGFLPPVAIPGTGVAPVQIGDMNGDGFPDIVGCGPGASASNSNLLIYLNDGTGKFTVSQTVPIPSGCNSVSLGDVNLDGHLDVVVTEITNSNPGTVPIDNFIQTFFGDGSGHVGTPVTLSNLNFDSTQSPASAGFTNCGIDDANGGNFYLDSKYSLIVNTVCSPFGQTQGGYTGTTFLAHSDGTGHFTFTEIKEGNEYLAGQAYDVNKDGKPDALYVSTSGSRYPYSNLYYAQNNGGGSFTFNNLVPDFNPAIAPNYFISTAVADFNGDGYNDIATDYYANGNNVTTYPFFSILNGSSTGAFTESQRWSLGDPSTYSPDGIIAADFNGDGKPDIALLNYNMASGINTLYIYTNTMGTSTTGCNVPTQTNTNIICAPTKGSTDTSPVTVSAASNVTGFTLNRLYLDNNSVYQTSSPIVNTQISAGGGNHTLVLVSYNNLGKAFSTTTNFTVGNPCLPSGSGAMICQPTQGETTNSPVSIVAGATAQSGTITAIRLYIDNVNTLTVNNPGATKSFQISQSVAASSGAHRLVVVGYQSTGGSVSASDNFTVTQNCIPSTAGAMICSPGANATVTSPFQFTAGATAQTGYITAVRLYVDNVANFTINNSGQNKSQGVNQPLSLTTGTHRLVFVGYNSGGGYSTATDTITVK
jgi:hypothetical protein